MSQIQLFNVRNYFECLAQTNKLALQHGFKPGTCSGLAGLEDMAAQFRQQANFILVDDTTTQSTYSNGVTFFRKDVYTVFILAAYRFDDMAQREEKMDLCRRIFRQMHARLIHDRDSMVYGDSLEYLNVNNIYSTELPRLFLNGTTGLYFMVNNEQPIDLTYSEDEWNK